MTKRIRRIVCALALGVFLTATWASQAQANDELCPFVRALGQKHQVCVTLP